MFNEESSEDVLNLIKQEEERLKKKVPSFLQETVKSSPSKLFSDYTKTGSPILKQAAGDSLKQLQQASDKASSAVVTKESLAGLGLIGFAGLATPKGRSILGKTIVKEGKELLERVAKPAAKAVFEGFKDISTGLLERLKGRSTVSKTFIEDTMKQAGIREADKVGIRAELALMKGDKISVPELAQRVKENQILPLQRVDLANTPTAERNVASGMSPYRYEGVTLPDELRGLVANYSEHVYESPIKTSAGHAGLDTGNYFAHARVEDLPNSKDIKYVREGISRKAMQGLELTGGDTRRVIEIQSDLFQKGRLEGEYDPVLKGKSGVLSPEKVKEIATKADARHVEMQKLEPYRNTWHERVIREEVKQAALDGKTKLQFPTGETAMKIEGLGENNNHWNIIKEGKIAGGLNPEELKIGQEIFSIDNKEWIITDVLGDGKFKAIAKEKITPNGARLLSEGKQQFDLPGTDSLQISNYAESFDISGKVDTNNPIYKFYEKDIGNFLKRNFNAKLVIDPQGVKWWELDTVPFAKNPVLAHGKAALGTIFAGAGAGAGVASMFSTSESTYQREAPTSVFEGGEQKQRYSFDEEDFRNRIVYTENRGAPEEELYTTIGVTGDLGKYQANPQTVKEWSEAWLGQKYTPKEFLSDPEAQERFFGEFMRVAKRLELTPEEAAVAWHTGWGELGTGSRETRDSRFREKLFEKMETPVGKRYVSIFNNEK